LAQIPGPSDTDSKPQLSEMSCRTFKIPFKDTVHSLHSICHQHRSKMHIPGQEMIQASRQRLFVHTVHCKVTMTTSRSCKQRFPTFQGLDIKPAGHPYHTMDKDYGF